MIENYGEKLNEITQAQWISFVRESFVYVMGWDFTGPAEFDNDDDYLNEVPDKDNLLALDPMYLLSLGREKLLTADVDMKKAFVYHDYTYEDHSEELPHEYYEQVERLMDLARIWASHGKKYGRVFALPKKKPNRNELLKALEEYARQHGIDHEIKAYYENIPVEDVVAGNPNAEYVSGPIYAWANWTVHFIG